MFEELAHITYGNSDRKEMLFTRGARNLTTIKKNLSPLIRVRDLTMKFSMDIVFIQEYIRCFIIFFYIHTQILTAKDYC